MALVSSGAHIASLKLLSNTSPQFPSKQSRGIFISNRFSNRTSYTVKTRSSAAQENVKTAGGVTEVDKDSFWPLVNQAGDKVVVLDMYTQWCGPCKLMFPKIVDLSTKYTDVVFLKLDCNRENKPLAKELGVRVVPTFKILKHKKIVAEIKGAKFEELVKTIESVRTS